MASPPPDEPDTAGLPAAAHRVADALMTIVSEVPRSDEPADEHPAVAARRVAARASARAAATAGGLALPPGPLGWLTVLPEMLAVWRIQARMVADIAALHGCTATLTREQMVWCLFRHTASQAVRDLAVRVGERLVVRPVAVGALRAVARRIGVHLTERAVARGAARWLPVAGAAGVAAYAWYDTAQVARSAIELFSQAAPESAPAPSHARRGVHDDAPGAS